MILALLLRPSAEAVIVAVPTPTAETSPADDTVATPASLVDQVTDTPPT